VGEVGAEGNGAAGGVGADFEEFLAVGSLEEDEFGAAGGFVAADFLEAEHVFVKRDGLFEVVHAVAGVEEFFDVHGVFETAHCDP
jgi:hypothetical protein